MDLSRYKNVQIFTKQKQEMAAPTVRELLGEERKLAKGIGTDVCAVLFGKDVGCLTRELIRYGTDKVCAVDHPLLGNFTTDVYMKVITDATGTYRPEIIFYGTTHIGRGLIPGIAAKVNTGLTADCIGLSIDPQDKEVMQIRPAFGGNLMATIICPRHHPQMSTVHPDVVQKLELDNSRQSEIVNMDVKLGVSDIRTQVLEIVKSAKEMVSLTDADVIVSDGRGPDNTEGFAVTKRLANAMDDVIGASKATVDTGWIDHSHQADQAGTTAKPRLYVTCSIFGAIQHLAGMQSSDIIIAINKNSRAPTFGVADYGLIEDLYEIVPMMAEALANEKII